MRYFTIMTFMYSGFLLGQGTLEKWDSYFPMDERLLDRKREQDCGKDSLLLNMFSNIPFYKVGYTEKEFSYAGKEHFFISLNNLPDECSSLLHFGTAYLPDIYSNTQKVVYNRKNDLLELTMTDRHGLIAGDYVMLEHKDGLKLESKVENVPNEFTFSVKNNLPKAYSYFVRGKRVDNLRHLDHGELLLAEVRINQILYQRILDLEKNAVFLTNKTESLIKEVQGLKSTIYQLKKKK